MLPYLPCTTQAFPNSLIYRIHIHYSPADPLQLFTDNLNSQQSQKTYDLLNTLFHTDFFTVLLLYPSSSMLCLLTLLFH